MSALLGIGGAHVDRIGHLDGPFAGGVSNPGRVREWVGGCMANTLRVARALGAGPVTLISARGGDGAGQLVEDTLTADGIDDHSAVFVDRATPSYMAIMDGRGEIVAALSDMRLYEEGLTRHLRRMEVRQRVRATPRLVIDANLPADSLQALCRQATGSITGLAVSRAKAARLRACLPQLDLVIMNRHELLALVDGTESDMTANLRQLRDLGATRAIVTDGANGALVMDNGHCTALPAAPIGSGPQDVTGAGDALAGTVLAHWPDMPLIDATRLGLAAAHITIGQQGPFFAGLNSEMVRAAARSTGASGHETNDG